ncbi:hypothetical protein BB561_005271 [Smittium simulii]|uniref:Late endosomal/lysosomal adaptor and MAPK and MTOR activator 1 n=1 Tax=Smittium simulii TaxID=133385 RepID=A0A2T9YB83_9FUNG|nr:hypothetical protein BB561_005271 [Smittium simulii]
MGNCCSNSTLLNAPSQEETSLLNGDSGVEQSSSSLTNATYDSLALKDTASIQNYDDMLQELATQTANNLINISDQIDDSKGLAPAHINHDYKRILSDFDSSTNMLTYTPSIKHSKQKTRKLTSSILYSLILPKSPPSFELELVDMAANQVAISMSEFSTNYVGNVFVPFGVNRT